MAKVLLSIDGRLLERLDQVASERGISRSALVAELTARGLGEPIGQGARAEVQQALDRLRELLSDVRDIESAHVIREERDAR